MKVALINNFPPYSGTGKVAYELFKNLRSEAKDRLMVDLFCTHVMRREERIWPQNREVKFLHDFAYKENEILSRLLIYFVDPYRVPRKYDVYHVTNHMLGRFASVLRPSVVTVHDVLQFRYRQEMSNFASTRIYNFLMDQSINSLKRANHLICVSQWSANEITKILNISPNKISVVYNGIDHNLFYPRNKEESRKKFSLPPSPKIILNVGSEIKRKNLSLVFTALRALREKNVNVILVRLGEITKDSKKMIDEFGLTKSIIYFDKLKDEELPFLYSCADVLLMPSFDEGFGFPIIEAQSCGIPVIASNRSSLPEIGGRSVFYIDDLNDSSETINLIEKVIFSDKDESSNLIAEGTKNSQRFSWEKNAKKTIEIYKKVIGE